jgi:transcriptional regulator with GAF, ATPase, and Fis domain
MDKTFERIDPQAIEQCLYYHWPGNIRELENLVERSVILSPGPAFFFDPLLEADGPAPQVSGLSLDAAIGAHLIKVLRMTNGKIYGQDGAAKLLGLKPSTLQAKLKRLKIDRRKTASDVRFLA